MAAVRRFDACRALSRRASFSAACRDNSAACRLGVTTTAGWDAVPLSAVATAALGEPFPPGGARAVCADVSPPSTTRRPLALRWACHPGLLRSVAASNFELRARLARPPVLPLAAVRLAVSRGMLPQELRPVRKGTQVGAFQLPAHPGPLAMSNANQMHVSKWGVGCHGYAPGALQFQHRPAEPGP